ncbi:TonB-dependent receptor [Sphingomonas hankyongi]|uniref:TonB-dependent receptor n=1 Tax=Sphingomonas hankyongi TaxID=2908209 RepID=A0ABT0RYK9_9SPHN|nr:TonB-dependent receptor [Sphingomonas hankyongi]MCL6728473.1 TonB-dependent receptor [Sphingomonas hankyongi]
MTARTIRALTLGFLASTAIASPVFAQTPSPADATPETPTTQSPAPGTNATDVTSNPVVQSAQDGKVPDETEIIITATKREENLQNVPMSVQAIGTRRLDQLNISNFEDYTKQLPSVSFQTAAPGFTTVYMRGVATGGDGNHTGSLPSVGFYLDEQPVTTIGGTLDVHIYDIARIESLAGPQGTLYGASSEAGTIRIITNKPELGVTTGRVDAEFNGVSHGGVGGSLEGMINLPVADNIAFRASAFYQHDAGYIDNVFGERTYCGDPITEPDTSPDAEPGDTVTVGCVRNGIHVDNAAFVKKNFNVNDTYGGRAALKIDLDDNWTVTPTILHQHSKTEGVWFMDDALGDLETQRFRKEPATDKFTQYALTIEGKIANFDITYAGAFMHRPNFSINDYTDYADAYDRYYEPYGGIANYQYFFDDAGNPIDIRQYITGGNNFKKLSQELRVASPAENRFRFIGGLFYQRQSNDILQEYHVDDLAASLSVNGRPGLLWLTKQERIDRDYAVFGELSFDVTPQFTLTGGGRWYKFDNTVFGFAGFGRDPNFIQDSNGDAIGDDPPPPNAVGSTKTGVAQCFTTSGDTLRESQINGTDTTLILNGLLPGTPCINVGRFADGVVKPKQSKDTGWTYRFNGTWKPHDSLMFYATRSKGFRPGGINRQPGLAPYAADFLINNELGWKTTLGPVRWNGAIYHQIWQKFQFSFLGENSLTVVQNGRDAKINGIETDVNYVYRGLTLNVAAAYTDAKTKDNICGVAGNPVPDCHLLLTPDDPTTEEDETEFDEITAPKGTRLPVTPKFKISATARYTWDMGPGKAHGQIGFVHQGSAPSGLNTADQAVTGTIPAYTLVDLFAGYDWSRYSVELFGTNIFDERNQLSRFVVCSLCGVLEDVEGNPTGLNQTKIVPGRPRTIGIRAGMKF